MKAAIGFLILGIVFAAIELYYQAKEDYNKVVKDEFSKEAIRKREHEDQKNP